MMQTRAVIVHKPKKKTITIFSSSCNTHITQTFYILLLSLLLLSR